jgi:hypothetical protein
MSSSGHPRRRWTGRPDRWPGHPGRWPARVLGAVEPCEGAGQRVTCGVPLVSERNRLLVLQNANDEAGGESGEQTEHDRASRATGGLVSLVGDHRARVRLGRAYELRLRGVDGVLGHGPPPGERPPRCRMTPWYDTFTPFEAFQGRRGQSWAGALPDALLSWAAADTRLVSGHASWGGGPSSADQARQSGAASTRHRGGIGKRNGHSFGSAGA